MGVDLILLPVEFTFGKAGSHDDANAQFHCTSILNLTRSRSLWEKIRELPSHGITAAVRTPLGVFEEDSSLWGAREMICDAYDTILRWVTAEDLVGLRDDVQNSQENRAAWAYLAELPPETKVVLYWC